MGLWEKPGIGDRVIPNCYGKKFSPKQMFNVSSTAIITYKLLKPLALGLGKVLVLLVVLKIIGSCLLTFHTRHTTHTHIHPGLKVFKTCARVPWVLRLRGRGKKTQEPWQKALNFSNPNYSNGLNGLDGVFGLVEKGLKFHIT
jgi:hypothetical protein